MNHVLQCFLNADMRGNHDGLAALAKGSGIDCHALKYGQLVVFVNRARDRVKVYGAGSVIAYKKPGGKIDLRVIGEIAEAFGGGDFNYSKALKSMLEKALQRKAKLTGAPGSV